MYEFTLGNLAVILPMAFAADQFTIVSLSESPVNHPSTISSSSSGTSNFSLSHSEKLGGEAASPSLWVNFIASFLHPKTGWESIAILRRFCLSVRNKKYLIIYNAQKNVCHITGGDVCIEGSDWLENLGDDVLAPETWSRIQRPETNILRNWSDQK